MENRDCKRDFYLSELKRWNKTINLVSNNDLLFLLDRHYLDSLSPLPYLSQNASLLDVGSGNGFPSIPIAIQRHDLSITAVEPNLKKAVFLEHIRNELELKNLLIVKERIDSKKNILNKSFDFITSRAFKNIPSFVEIAYIHLKEHGKAIYFNSFVDNILHDLSTLKNKHINSVENIVYKSDNNKQRSLVIFSFL